MLRIEHILENLALERPIFHSEADFQHALAWKFHQQLPNANLRLEYRYSIDTDPIYLDIRLAQDDVIIPIELKYKAKPLEVFIENEVYFLRDQSTQDTGRYDFLKDIQRLETVLQHHGSGTGHAIFLTNDSSYWKPPKSDRTTNDREFYIYEGRTLSGTLQWNAKAGEGTTRGREKPIRLGNTYALSWNDYSAIEGNMRNNQFRYVAVEVKCP